MKNCPKCEIELAPKNIGCVEVDECHSCKGIWFDEDELRQAKDSTDPDLNWFDLGIWKHEDMFKARDCPRMCPVCNEAMVTFMYGPSAVEVDCCPLCRGTWLDKGEFKRIIDALEEEIAKKSLSSYLKDSVKEGLEIIRGPESFISEWKDLRNLLRLMQYRLYVEHPRLLNNITGAQRSFQ